MHLVCAVLLFLKEWREPYYKDMVREYFKKLVRSKNFDAPKKKSMFMPAGDGKLKSIYEFYSLAADLFDVAGFCYYLVRLYSINSIIATSEPCAPYKY